MVSFSKAYFERAHFRLPPAFKHGCGWGNSLLDANELKGRGQISAMEPYVGFFYLVSV